VEKDACYGKRFSHKKQKSTIQMGCFLKQQFVMMRVLLKLNFTKSQLLLRCIDCLVSFCAEAANLFVIYKTVYENIVYTFTCTCR
jgi:hypothetical protein